MIRLGLRIDVDTLRGTRQGVPRLLGILARQKIKGTFFFSLGPDNMGRHLWRLLRPAFLVKMLRSRAASLYGWSILLRGTFWPGPVIAHRCSEIIRRAADQGHEIGMHAWDHHLWQNRIEKMDSAEIWDQMHKGWEALKLIIGREPDCSAAPGWRATDTVLDLRDLQPNRYNSDCRGTSVFTPVLSGSRASQPQIPTTLPTYDEWIRPSLNADDYYRHILACLAPDRLNVLTIHAEVEGMMAAEAFDRFLNQAHAAGVQIVPLGDLLPQGPAPSGRIVQRTVPGREGWVAVQEELS